MATLQSTLKLTLLDQVSARAKLINRSLDALQRQTHGMLTMSRGILAFGATYLGVTQGVESTVGAALSFESAFANVQKVVGGTDEQMQRMRRTILDMSKTLPISAEGIAAIYAAAGASNIPLNEIDKFAEMVAKVSTAWEIPVADTGQALAEIKNQLHLGVADLGLFADAINHLDNTTAANAPKLLEYTKRVAATGEMFGFSAAETLAFGGSMIASGAESEVAATSFRNMGKALTKGTQATKANREAFKRLGLDSVKTAKSMQKNALKTTLDVLDRIGKLPEWERISVASALFGDEARALMPVINNSAELQRQLGLVADQANYAGSAFKEYVVRANTVGNVLQITGNKIRDLFRGIGDDMLPGIKDAALGIGHIIDTLDQRATIFDQIGAAYKGFMHGMGAETPGVRQLVEDLGDLLLGADETGDAADKIGRIFANFQQFGQSVKRLSDDVGSAVGKFEKFFNLKPGKAGETIAEIAGWGATLGAASIGIGLAASAISALGRALWVLSGGALVVGGAKGLAKLFGAFKDVPNLPAKVPTTPKAPPVVPQPPSWFAAWGARLSLWAGAAFATYKALDDVPHAGFESAQKNNPDLLQELERQRRIRAEFLGGFEGGRHAAYAGVGPRPGDAVPGEITNWPPGYRPMTGTSEHPGKMRDDHNIGATPIRTIFDGIRDMLGGTAAQPAGSKTVALDTATISAMMTPRGTQDVRVTNKEPPHVTVQVGGITITGVVDPKAAVASAASQLGDKVKNAVESANTD